ncbi:MAG TPA: FkbM family methyltransferase [Solirubrobacteraceae bacterium]|jgi:FkbM family methyltransferase|nr:FkbM family methyltransferase [Solirubrobacteraceae bacterium]
MAQRVREAIYPQTLASAERLTFTVASQTGSPFTGNTGDLVAYPVAINGYFNWRNVAIATAVCGDGDAIVEVGANIGSETVSFSDLVGASGVVYAFEPYPPNIDALQHNVASTIYRNVTVFPVALSDHSGVESFVAPPSRNSGYGHLGSDHGETQTPSPDNVSVRCDTLDAFLPEMRPPQLVVIDAEGHESLILKGAEQTLRGRPVLVLEVLETLLARTGSSPREVATYLAGFGYELFEIQRFRLAAFSADDELVPGASDWLAVPRDSGLSARIARTLARAGFMPCLPVLNPISRRRAVGSRLGRDHAGARRS